MTVYDIEKQALGGLAMDSDDMDTLMHIIETHGAMNAFDIAIDELSWVNEDELGSAITEWSAKNKAAMLQQ